MKNAASTSRTSSKNFDLDRGLTLCVVMLMGIGLVAVYSASFIFASENYGDALFFFKRQLGFIAVALAALISTSFIPYQIFRKFFWVLFTGIVLALLAVFIPGIGHRAGGAARWISLPGGFHLEPSEFAKLMAPFAFAYLLTRKKKFREKPWQSIALPLLAVFVPIAILLKQPDFGSSAIIIAVGVTVLFCFGLKWIYFAGAAALSVPAFYFFVWQVPYRHRRVEAFLNPWSDPSQSGFQMIQSLLSFYNGGFWGMGLGKGQGKLFFLPEAHTDFILSVLGEETGFIGLFVILSLYIWLVMRGLQISVNCQDSFGKRLAIGMTALIGYQAVINGGVVLGLLPTKGLTMPFLSYGGSSLVAMCCACGVLLNIHRQSGYRKT